jgi:hypothetical protein
MPRDGTCSSSVELQVLFFDRSWFSKVALCQYTLLTPYCSTFTNTLSVAFWLRYVYLQQELDQVRPTTNLINRSSVVSVLFSLISETFLRELLRLSTFWIHRGPLSLLMPSVSVASIALPLADANHLRFFISHLRLSKVLEKMLLSVIRIEVVLCCL